MRNTTLLLVFCAALFSAQNQGSASEYKISQDSSAKENISQPLLAASYSPKGLSVSYVKTVKKSSNKDQFYIDYKKVTRSNFLKFTKSDSGKLDYYFGYIENIDDRKIFSAIEDINLQLPDKFLDALDKKNSENKTL